MNDRTAMVVTVVGSSGPKAQRVGMAALLLTVITLLIGSVNTRIDDLQGTVNTRISDVHSRIGDLNDRVTGMESRIDELNDRMTGIENGMRELRNLLIEALKAEPPANGN